MSKFGKIQNNSGKTSTHRAENIFPKYLLYNVHEIAQKYLREKKRYSSFSDSVDSFRAGVSLKKRMYITLPEQSFSVGEILLLYFICSSIK